MSEEILKALTQLFAIVTKQDAGVTQTERDYVLKFFKTQLNPDAALQYAALYDQLSGFTGGAADPLADEDGGKAKLVSVKDSVKILGICRKINKTLTQKQKFISFIKVLELVASDGNFSTQRMAILNTVAEVFNINSTDYKTIVAYVSRLEPQDLDLPGIMVAATGLSYPFQQARYMPVQSLKGAVLFLWLRAEDICFVRYVGKENLQLNGLTMSPGAVSLFPPGSVLKTPKGESFYYTDIAARFLDFAAGSRINFEAVDLHYRFPGSQVGLNHINISETEGRLVAIMGASGAGKTTLLNVLAGLEKPHSGSVTINGTAVHGRSGNTTSMIGYVAQDDLLIEQLTVYENLYFNARLCFGQMADSEIEARVHETLRSLDLLHIKDVQVGNLFNKKISGGQRKRLNIALELIREPAVLFVDEPTSGLSSRDSENVIDLLKELTLKGKLVFAVIHQPSSDIFKMFDRLYLLDTGGYPVFYGNPVEAVTWFKEQALQVDRDQAQCSVCGNVNPEQIFNILEAQVVDEYGQPTGTRRILPNQWYDRFAASFKLSRRTEALQPVVAKHARPGWLQQFWVYARRDFKNKASNLQYLVINFLEAPALALLLAFIIRYINTPDGSAYLYRYNDNVPAYLLICVIVAIFMGLTVSAEEIISDRKNLRREQFLHLSRSAYLSSKLLLLFSLSAIQTLSFVVVGNLILEIDSMYASYWLVLFSASCFANLVGLNISALFSSAITVYILIPLLLIPQMILSGAIFDFDKLNEAIGRKGSVPVIANLMASRWAYEALAVRQQLDNPYQQPVKEIDAAASQANFATTYLIPELWKQVDRYVVNKAGGAEHQNARQLLLTNLQHPIVAPYTTGALKLLQAGNHQAVPAIEASLNKAEAYFYKKAEMARLLADQQRQQIEAATGQTMVEMRNQYYNQALHELTTNANEKEKITLTSPYLLQVSDPVFRAVYSSGIPDLGNHFLAGSKPLFGRLVHTFWYNILIMWVMVLVLYAVLYFNLLNRAGRLLQRIVPGLAPAAK